MSRDLTSFAKKGAEIAYCTLIPWSVYAVNSTPVIAGGPDGNTVHRVGGRLEWWGIRPTAVRGVWRWWIRALLAGLLWEKGYTCNYYGLAQLEEKLGLGSTREASKVFLQVRLRGSLPPLVYRKPYFSKDEIKKKGKHIDIRMLSNNFEKFIENRKKYKNIPLKFLYLIPRYALWSMGEKGESTTIGKIAERIWEKQPIPPGGVHLDIRLYVSDINLAQRYEALYKYALWLALALGGIGQATSRGFGKFQLKGPNGEEISQITDIDDILDKIRGTIEKMDIKLDEISGCQKINKEEDLPLTPTFHKDTLEIRFIEDVKYIQVIPRRRGEEGCIKCRGPCRNIWEVLQSIGYATLKNSWKACEECKLRTKGGKYHTWPLGLPRMAKIRDENAEKIIINNKYPEKITSHQKIPTGYLFEEIRRLKNTNDENSYVTGRIQSLIRFTPISRGKRFGIIVYGFLTQDLEYMLDELYHYEYHRAKKFEGIGILNITHIKNYAEDKDVKTIFGEVLDYILKILRYDIECKRCGSWL